MVAQGCSVDEVAEEFRARWKFPPLAAYRYAAGLTQLQAACRYNEVVGDAAAGVDNSLISKLELWPDAPSGKAPTAYNLAVLAAVYGTLPHRLVALADVDKLPRKDQVVLRATHQQPILGTDTAVTTPRAVTRNVDAQCLVSVAPTEPAALPPSLGDGLDVDHLVLAAADQSRVFAAWTESTELGSTTMEIYRSQLGELARRFLYQPAAPLFPDLARLRSALLQHFRRHQPIRQTRELYALTGMTCVVLAHASHVLGHGPAGMTHAQLARLCAEEAGHVELHAWALGTQALLAEAANHPREALRYLRAASDQLANSRVPGTAAVRLASYEARLAARVGQHEQACAALRAAEDSRQRAHDGGEIADLDDVGGILSFPDAKQEFFAAEANLHLGRHDLAERAALAAISSYMSGPPDQLSYGDVALAQLDVATARLAASDLDGVFEAVRPVLALPAELRIEPLRGPLTTLAANLAHQPYISSHLATDVRAAIETYTVRPQEIPDS
jgi:hypothetical protein